MNDHQSPSTPDTDRVAVVVNPSKFPDAEAVRRQASAVIARLGFPEPLWFETTPENTGASQAAQAVEEGASVVLVIGGDGTVTAVAEALRKTGVPFGLVPAGTGNLLARNLGLPLGDLAAAVEIGLTGADRAVDLGMVAFDDRAEQGFVVMTGVGFDAEVMAKTDDRLKEKIGWFAYLLAGTKSLVRKGFGVRVEADDVRKVQQRAQTVVVGNCGELQNGLKLLPEAVIDDGILDTVVLSPRGVVGWLSLLLYIASGTRRGHRRLQSFASASVAVRTRQPIEAQVDGDPIGQVRSMACRVIPGALLIRVPPASGSARSAGQRAEASTSA